MAKQEELSYWLKKQLSAFEEKFIKADKDKNGSLSFAEIRDVLKNAGFNGSEDEMKTIFKFADVNKDAKISRQEYMEACKKAPKISLQAIVLRRAFRKYDKDGSGFLTRDELMAAASSDDVGANIPAEKISEMLIALTTDADKKISYEEFLQHFNYQQTATLLRDVFNAIDKDKSGFLTRKEILDAIKADDELAFDATNLSKLLITHCKDQTDKIKYEEFAKAVGNQAKK